MIKLRVVKRGVIDFTFLENFLKEKLQDKTVKSVTISENVYNKILCRYGRKLDYHVDRYCIKEGLFFCNENYSFEIGRELHGKYGYYYEMRIIDNKKYTSEKFFKRIDFIRENNKFFYDEELANMYYEMIRIQEEDLFYPFQLNLANSIKDTKELLKIREVASKIYDQIEERENDLQERKNKLKEQREVNKMINLDMVLRAERTNNEGKKEYFVQSVTNGENYNWISENRLEMIKANPNVTLKIEIEKDPDSLNVIENLSKRKELQNPEKLFEYVKENFLENSKINRGSNFTLAKKFINTYLNSLKLNDLRVEHLGIRSMEFILQETNNLKEFKNIMQAVKSAYNKGKYVIESYYQVLDDLKFFEKDEDWEEVESINTYLQEGTRITDNLIMY